MLKNTEMIFVYNKRVSICDLSNNIILRLQMGIKELWRMPCYMAMTGSFKSSG